MIAWLWVLLRKLGFSFGAQNDDDPAGWQAPDEES